MKCAYISNKIHKKIKFSKRMYVYYLLTRPLKTHLYARLCAPRSSETVGLDHVTMVLYDASGAALPHARGVWAAPS